MQTTKQDLVKAMQLYNQKVIESPKRFDPIEATEACAIEQVDFLIACLIETFVASYFESEQDVATKVDERIYSGDYIDEDWADDGNGYDDETDWYRDYGRGEVETEIVDEIIKAIADRFFDGSTDYYFDSTYGDINDLIYETYPILKTS